jgi:hypothetical protein
VGLGAGQDEHGKTRPTGVRILDRPARSNLLYRLSYPGRNYYYYYCYYCNILHTDFMDILNLFAICFILSIGLCQITGAENRGTIIGGSYHVDLFVVKGPAADATDAPQP